MSLFYNLSTREKGIKIVFRVIKMHAENIKIPWLNSDDVIIIKIPSIIMQQ